MSNLIDKDALVAEIERIEHETNYEPFTDEVLGKRYVCKSLFSFINTLDVKEVDLNDETCKDLKYDGTCMYIANITGKTMCCEYIHCTRKIKSTERKII